MSRKPFKRTYRDGYIAEQPTEWVNGRWEGIYLMVSFTLIKVCSTWKCFFYILGGYHGSHKANHITRKEREDSVWSGGRTLTPSRDLETGASQRLWG